MADHGVASIIYSISADDVQQCADKKTKQVQVSSTKRPTGIIGKIKREHKVNLVFEDIISTLKAQDILYLRIPYPSPSVSKILRQPRACKIVIEHQTIEPSEYRLKGKYWYLLSDFLFGDAIRRYTDATVGVTDEITQYEVSRSGNYKKPHITIGNGFDVASAPVRRPVAYNDGDLHLLCVANVNRWHGLDRLLQGLATHNGTQGIVLHITGEGPELPHLQKLAGGLGISDQVVFHGFRTGEALDALFDQCHIAVGSLGIHRIGLREASTLKVREYCARGIPFIYGISDPDFPTDYPYTLHLPADESPIEIERVLAFSKEIYADLDHPQKMRRYAEEHLDWSVKMRRLKEFLEALVGENGGESVPEASESPVATVQGQKAPADATLPNAVQGDTPSGKSRERMV
ncbi:glycosyltransferase [Methanoculleus sp.]|uniref:glycosyltransferase n=1 Tax=Methanoculleus sp. TaxID=90427 RepID=UPI001BD4E1D1|nr:glycosyltransferase [Methanoculleus sp.]